MLNTSPGPFMYAVNVSLIVLALRSLWPLRLPACCLILTDEPALCSALMIAHVAVMLTSSPPLSRSSWHPTSVSCLSRNSCYTLRSHPGITATSLPVVEPSSNPQRSRGLFLGFFKSFMARSRPHQTREFISRSTHLGRFLALHRL